MEITYEKTLKPSEKVTKDDELRIGGLYMRVVETDVNGRDEMILRLEIIGQSVKKRSKALLIIPKKLPIETLS